MFKCETLICIEDSKPILLLGNGSCLYDNEFWLIHAIERFCGYGVIVIASLSRTISDYQIIQ